MQAVQELLLVCFESLLRAYFFISILTDFFQCSVTYLTVAAVAIMTIGAVLAGANDLEFHAVGYMWMILNCCFTSCYTLYMRYASTSIKLSK